MFYVCLMTAVKWAVGCDLLRNNYSEYAFNQYVAKIMLDPSI